MRVVTPEADGPRRMIDRSSSIFAINKAMTHQKDPTGLPRRVRDTNIDGVIFHPKAEIPIVRLH